MPHQECPGLVPSQDRAFLCEVCTFSQFQVLWLAQHSYNATMLFASNLGKTIAVCFSSVRVVLQQWSLWQIQLLKSCLSQLQTVPGTRTGKCTVCFSWEALARDGNWFRFKGLYNIRLKCCRTISTNYFLVTLNKGTLGPWEFYSKFTQDFKVLLKCSVSTAYYGRLSIIKIEFRLSSAESSTHIMILPSRQGLSICHHFVLQ